MTNNIEGHAPLILRFPAPTTPLSINQANRMHWGGKKRQLDPWREATWAAWYETSMDERRRVQGKPCWVTVHLPFKTKGRKDAHNYTGTNVKAIIDTLVKSGVWEDDVAAWVSVVDPVCYTPEKGQPLEVLIVLRPR